MTTSPKPTKDEVLKLALEALESIDGAVIGILGLIVNADPGKDSAGDKVRTAITAIREALAQPDADDKAGGEAIAKLRRTEFGSGNNRKSATHIDILVPLDVLNALPAGTKLYTRPQPQAAQPAELVALTKNQRDALLDSVDWYNFPEDLIIATEMKHGITAKDQS